MIHTILNEILIVKMLFYTLEKCLSFEAFFHTKWSYMYDYPRFYEDIERSDIT